MNPAKHYTRKSDEWETPQAFFEALDREFHFDLDACANESNAKCEKYFSVAEDGLEQNWGGVQRMV